MPRPHGCRWTTRPRPWPAAASPAHSFAPGRGGRETGPYFRFLDQAHQRSAGDPAEALGDLGPVDHVPPGLDVVGPAVLVLEVVGVLPHVDAQQRRLALADRVVLVGGRDDRQ